MEAISIFLVVMSCSSDALVCEDLSRAEPYPDMATCHAARERALRPPSSPTAAERMLLARCQYVLVESTRGDETGPAELRSAQRLAW